MDCLEMIGLHLTKWILYEHIYIYIMISHFLLLFGSILNISCILFDFEIHIFDILRMFFDRRFSEGR